MLREAARNIARETPTAPETVERHEGGSFEKEIYVQAYRIESVLKSRDSETLKRIASLELGHNVMANPILFAFFEKYENRDELKNLIEGVKSNREKLLYDIRKVIHRAKLREASDIEAEKETERIEEEMTRSLEDIPFGDFELMGREITDSFEVTREDIEEGRVTFDTFQENYKKIFNAQRVLSSKVEEFVKNFESASKKVEAYNKQNTGWTSHVAGIYYWARNKVSSSQKRRRKRAERAVKKAREHYEANLNKEKELKEQIKKRSQEVTKGLDLYKRTVRDQLRKLINSEQWTREHESKRQNLVDRLSEARGQLISGFESSKETIDGITFAQRSNSDLRGALRDKYENINASEYSITRRIDNVKQLAENLKEKFPEDDPRRERALEMARYIENQVVNPLLSHKQNLEGAAYEAKNQYLEAEQRNIKMESLKADLFLEQGRLVGNLERVELKVGTQSAKIEELTRTREQLLKGIEEMETFYMVTDEFKESMGGNLEEIIKHNDQTFEALGKQGEYLEHAKPVDRGLFTSLWNTVGIGKIGAFFPAWAANNLWPPRVVSAGYNLISNWNEWKGWGGFKEQVAESEKWSITGALGRASQFNNEWLEKGGFRQYGWLKEGWMGGVMNFGAGISSGALDLCTGLSTLAFNPGESLDGIVNVFTSLSQLREMGKQVIQYNHWNEGRYGIAAGKNVFDTALILLTAGVGKGVKAAGAAGKAGNMGKMAKAYTVTRGIGRRAWWSVKKLPSIPKVIVKGTLQKAKAGFKILQGGITGKGLSLYRDYKIIVLEQKLGATGAKVAKYIGKFNKKGHKFDPKLRELVDDFINQKGRLTPDQLTSFKNLLENARMTSSLPGFHAAVDKIGFALANHLKVRSKQIALTGLPERSLTSEAAMRRVNELANKSISKTSTSEQKVRMLLEIDDTTRALQALRKEGNLTTQQLKGVVPELKKVAKLKIELRKKLGLTEATSRDLLQSLRYVDELGSKAPKGILDKIAFKGEINRQIDYLGRLKASHPKLGTLTDPGILQLTKKLGEIRYFEMARYGELLGKGKLKDAVKNLPDKKVSALPGSVLKSLKDYTFTKYLLLPNYMTRIEDLWDPDKVAKIPTGALRENPDTRAVERARKEYLKQIEKYLKVKSSSEN